MCPQNKIIQDNIVKAWHYVNSPKYKKIMCSISGGSDSDIMLDLLFRCDKEKKIDYVWFDTGLEYQATKDHLVYLEKKYGIEIIREKAIKPIPLSCKEYGQPFISKQVSEHIYYLQQRNFKWEDKSFEELMSEYGKGKWNFEWWCDEKRKGNDKRFSISYNKYLKEFLIANPPNFPISNKCCNYAKKNLRKDIMKRNKYDLHCTGVRKAEGGVRAIAYKSCFDDNGENDKYTYDNYRPIFWYKNQEKIEYENAFDIKHSRCYTDYGMVRTGCVGCPYDFNFEEHLETMKQYEPKLYKAACNVFGDSYEYTKKYREFCKEMKAKEAKEKTKDKKK